MFVSQKKKKKKNCQPSCATVSLEEDTNLRYPNLPKVHKYKEQISSTQTVSTQNGFGILMRCKTQFSHSSKFAKSSSSSTTILSLTTFLFLFVLNQNCIRPTHCTYHHHPFNLIITPQRQRLQRVRDGKP